MSVSFPTIPSDLRVPLFWAEMDNSEANTTQSSGPSLLIGFSSADSTIAKNKVTIMPSAALAGKVAGRGSQLARMVAQ
ncbi:phage tail sheath subtilisin-like domain-containing protein, partial [Enterobacter asburiae]